MFLPDPILYTGSSTPILPSDLEESQLLDPSCSFQLLIRLLTLARSFPPQSDTFFVTGPLTPSPPSSIIPLLHFTSRSLAHKPPAGGAKTYQSLSSSTGSRASFLRSPDCSSSCCTGVFLTLLQRKRKHLEPGRVGVGATRASSLLSRSLKGIYKV